MHVNGSNFGEPKKGYLNVTLGNLWATQPIALLIWPPLLSRYIPYHNFNLKPVSACIDIKL